MGAKYGGYAESTYVFQENLEDTTGLFIDEAGNTLDTSTTSKTTNSLTILCVQVSTKHGNEYGEGKRTGLVMP